MLIATCLCQMFIALYVVGHSTTHMRNSWKEGTRTLDLWITSQAKSPRCVRSTPHELKRYAHINSGSVSYSFSDCPQRCQLSTTLPSAIVTGNAIPGKFPNLSSQSADGKPVWGLMNASTPFGGLCIVASTALRSKDHNGLTTTGLICVF